jgi:hypothetical protein
MTTAALLPIAGCSGTSANTPVVSANGSASTLVSSNPAVEQALESSCFDCHSDQKSGPWNTKLAPSYLFGLNGARESLNFAEWHSYSVDRRKAETVAITKAIEDGSMPRWDYELLHPSARLTDEQRKQLLQWAAGGHLEHALRRPRAASITAGYDMVTSIQPVTAAGALSACDGIRHCKLNVHRRYFSLSDSSDPW